MNFLFWFVVSSWGTHLSSFFTFPTCFKCQMTLEWSILHSLAISHVVVRGSALMMLSVSYCQLLMASHCGSYCQDLISLENFLNHHCTVHLLAVPGPNVLLMLRVISLLYNSFWTRKLLEFAFCLISFL